MLSGWRVSFQVLFLAAALPFGWQAQETPASTETAISELASRIGERLKTLRTKRVIVADLTGPQGQAHPVGKWLAEQLSRCLAEDFPTLEVLNRPPLQPFSSAEHSPIPPGATSVPDGQASARDWARGLEANAVITGIFASVPKGIGISLQALSPYHAGPLLAEEWGEVPLSDRISALSQEPLPSVSPGVPTAGRNGFTVPECIYCPVPGYTDEARHKKLIGTVVLQVKVGTDGKPTHIFVWKSLGGGLDAQAVKIISTWKLKPAVAPDGKPAEVTTPVEVMFHLN